MPTSCRGGRNRGHLKYERGICVSQYTWAPTCGMARPMAIPPSRNMLLWIQFTSLSMQPLVWMYVAASEYSNVCIPCPHMVLITICSRTVTEKVKSCSGENVAKAERHQKVHDLAFCHDATWERDGAALPTGVLHAAVEVHVNGPVSICDSTAAGKLGTHKDLR